MTTTIIENRYILKQQQHAQQEQEKQQQQNWLLQEFIDIFFPSFFFCFRGGCVLDCGQRTYNDDGDGDGIVLIMVVVSYINNNDVVV